jgi:hypothetical protein
LYSAAAPIKPTSRVVEPVIAKKANEKTNIIVSFLGSLSAKPMEKKPEPQPQPVPMLELELEVSTRGRPDDDPMEGVPFGKTLHQSVPRSAKLRVFYFTKRDSEMESEDEGKGSKAAPAPISKGEVPYESPSVDKDDNWSDQTEEPKDNSCRDDRWVGEEEDNVDNERSDQLEESKEDNEGGVPRASPSADFTEGLLVDMVNRMGIFFPKRLSQDNG